MPRLQIELTSARPDGSWTWRVAGARQPKGTLAGDLLPSGTKVGDVLRVEAEIELEGTLITAVLGGQSKRPEPERLEILGTPKPFEAVTTSLVPKSDRPRRGGSWDGGDRDRDRDRGGRPGGPAGRSSGPAGRPGGSAGRSSGPEAPGGPRPDNARRGDDQRPGVERGGRPERPARPRSDRSSRADRPDRGAPTGERSAAGGERHGVEQGGRRAPRRTDREGAPTSRPGGPRPGGGRQDGRPTPAPQKAKRLTPANTHRAAVLAALAPEERAVAEHVLQGGVPAVRRAMQDQNAKARAEGQGEVNPDALVALAEDLLPRLKAAEWRDRAEAAVTDVDELNLRDLRSVVAGADAARDDESRLLAKTLREGLERREAKERQDWLDEISKSLNEGRVVRALRLSARPPDPRTRFPIELVSRLSESAGAALASDSLPDRWITVLEAVIESPVRRSVKPAGVPQDQTVLTAARKASGRVPALAAMLGIDMPPPPGPLRPGIRPPRPPVRTPRPRPAHRAGLPTAPARDTPPAVVAEPAVVAGPPAEPAAAVDTAPAVTAPAVTAPAVDTPAPVETAAAAESILPTVTPAAYDPDYRAERALGPAHPPSPVVSPPEAVVASSNGADTVEPPAPA